MKLHIGENIRNLRKQVGLTQEQLAERLGISYQSVSRWELGVTYPDMEFVPVLAELFGVSADVLFGMPEAQKEKQAETILTELAKACGEQPLDPEKICRLIRDLRRDHLRADCFWHFWLSGNEHAYRHPDILPEVRLTVETILDSNGTDKNKNDAIEYFASIEDDEHIDAFLNRYAASRDLCKDTLLFDRYRKRGEQKKADLMRQHFLFQSIDKLVGNSGLWVSQKRMEIDLPLFHAHNKLGLTLLHDLCMAKDRKRFPVSGDGTVDIWVEPRLWMGFHEVCYLAAEGDTERALDVLEDAVSLLEKAMRISEPHELGCASPWLADMRFTAEETYGYIGTGAGLLRPYDERALYIANEDFCFALYPSLYKKFLTVRENNDWYTRACHLLDPLRDHVRYLACVERVSALVEIQERTAE